MKTAMILTLMMPIVAQADPQPAVLELMPYMDVTAACFDAAGDSAQASKCAGQGSAICMEAEQGGYSTVGMMFCVMAETESWDRLLNREYGTTMDRLRAMDAQDATHFPEFATRAEKLRDAQRAWITLRDAQCSLEYAMWGAGSMRQTAGAGCRLDQTAQRSVFLRFLGQMN